MQYNFLRNFNTDVGLLSPLPSSGRPGRGRYVSRMQKGYRTRPPLETRKIKKRTPSEHRHLLIYY